MNTIYFCDSDYYSEAAGKEMIATYASSEFIVRRDLNRSTSIITIVVIFIIDEP